MVEGVGGRHYSIPCYSVYRGPVSLGDQVWAIARLDQVQKVRGQIRGLG